MRRLFVLSFGFVTVMAIASAAAFAQIPTCAQLNVDPKFGLTGNPVVLAHTTTLVPPVGPNPAFCRVDFIVSERGGTAFGYAAGEIQQIGLRVGLPANTADGGSGGGVDGQGAWNGKVRNLGGGGLVGMLSAVTPATNARYVGSSTDGGHVGQDPAFGVIQATHELNLGKIEDFFSESLRLQYQWALRLANTYYGKPAVRNYWDGCSTGGRQGLVLAAKYGNDFDGFLIGAPHTNHVQNSAGPMIGGWANKDIANGSVTAAKFAATVDRLVKACDALDGVVDNLLTEPRMCKAGAVVNICGAPGAANAPDCLTTTEASVVDITLDGARNDLGRRVWFPFGRAAALGIGIPPATGFNGVFGWANKDMTFDWRPSPLSNLDDLTQLATNTVADYINMSTPNLDLAKNHGAKILMWQGLADQLIPFQSNIYYYSEVLDYYGGQDNVSPFFRFFLAPGVQHCGGGAGPQPQNLFDTMVDWAQNGVAPDSIMSAGGGRTRPLCPFPQTAIYDGAGDPNVASSFKCGGNIQTKEAKCDGLIAKFKHETEAAMESLGGEDDISCGFAFLPVTVAELSPSPVNGWYRDPTVTLRASDKDLDLDHTEYLLDSGGSWATYAGPFQVTGDGEHRLQYRSVDKVGHVESVQSLSFKIDATAPAFSGLPVKCTIWPPNNKLVEVAAVTASDNGSGVAANALSVSVVSNEPVDASDIVVQGGTVKVRAQRLGNGTGRSYVINARVSDVAGNSGSATATCTVPHDQGK